MFYFPDGKGVGEGSGLGIPHFWPSRGVSLFISDIPRVCGGTSIYRTANGRSITYSDFPEVAEVRLPSWPGEWKFL